MRIPANCPVCHTERSGRGVCGVCLACVPGWSPDLKWWQEWTVVARFAVRFTYYYYTGLVRNGTAKYGWRFLFGLHPGGGVQRRIAFRLRYLRFRSWLWQWQERNELRPDLPVWLRAIGVSVGIVMEFDRQDRFRAQRLFWWINQMRLWWPTRPTFPEALEPVPPEPAPDIVLSLVILPQRYLN